jgi:hypothetical protein
MFEKDFFQNEQPAGPSKSGRIVGDAGMWGLHVAAVAFAIYSGYHGISATAQYRADSGLGMAAGIAGIVTIELVLLSLYMAWHNGKITGAAQSIAAGVTGLIGFILACLGIVADSQLQAGIPLSPWLSAYLSWRLPIAPAVMALGALLTHELAPAQLRARRESNERDELEETRFDAHIAAMRAELDAARTVANMQLNARTAAAKQIAAWYGSEPAQRAITSTAIQNAPAMLRAIGINVDEAADGPVGAGSAGDMDLQSLVDYLVDERLNAAESTLSGRPAPVDWQEPVYENGNRPTERPAGR